MAELAIHPEALAEYRAATQWYRERNPDAALRFVDEVERVRDQLEVRPDYYGWYDDDFREAVLVYFPFSVIYRTDSRGDSLIVAVAHASREPGYWRDRIP